MLPMSVLHITSWKRWMLGSANMLDLFHVRAYRLLDEMKPLTPFRIRSRYLNLKKILANSVSLGV